MATARSVEQIPVTLKCHKVQVIGYERAAAAAGSMSRQAWCKAILDAAAGISAMPDQLKAAQRAARKLQKSA